MALTDEQLRQAAAAEASQLRMAQLQSFSYPQLQELLTGNPAQAALWIRSAADCGLAAAQLRFGRMLLAGTGISADPAAALVWFRRAAAQGDAESMNMVGRCLENGWGTAADLGQAADHYQMAAQRGHDWGEYNFANMLFDGRGIACDRHRALFWYRRAARRGHGRAMNLLGRCFEEGWGCDRDSTSAALWYERSAESGYFRGQFNWAAVLAQHGRAAAAAHWYLQAAAGGDRAIRGAILTALVNVTDPLLSAVRAQVLALYHSAAAEEALPASSATVL